MKNIEECLTQYAQFAINEKYLSPNTKIIRIPELEDEAENICKFMIDYAKKLLRDSEHGFFIVNHAITNCVQAGTIMAAMYLDDWKYLSKKRTVAYLTSTRTIGKDIWAAKFFAAFHGEPNGYRWNTTGISEAAYRDLEDGDDEQIENADTFFEKYKNTLIASYILGISYQMNIDIQENHQTPIPFWFG